MADNQSKADLLKILKRFGQNPVTDIPGRNPTMNPMPTYTDRSTFFQDGSHADYQGPINGAGRGTLDRMPGTSPEQPVSPVEALLRRLRIIPTPPSVYKRPEVGHPGDKYVKYI